MHHPPFFSNPHHVYLPHISRIFSARYLLWCFGGALGLFLVLWGVKTEYFRFKTFYTEASVTKAFDEDVVATTKKYEQWKQIITMKPDYRDGYIMVAYYASKLGKDKEVGSYINKIKQLDPNYPIPHMLTVSQ